MGMFGIFVFLALGQRFWQIGQSPKKREREENMQIGKPLRKIIIEPLELPVKPPADEPEPNPIQLPEPVAEKVPISQ